MPVTQDIVQAHYKPQTVMTRLLAMGPRDDRVLAMIMGACLIMFASQWPWRAREAHETGVPLVDLIQTDFYALIFFAPLACYGIAALTRIVAMIFRGKGSWYSARLALFWSLLAATPLVVLAGLVKGFIGLGLENDIVGGLWLAVFLWIWASSMWRAERG